jgi:hypothetical protein
MKDLREQLGTPEWPFDPKHYTIQSVAETLAKFLDQECAKVKDPAVLKNTNMGFLVGGYSRPGDLGETWSIEVAQGKSKTPVELRKKEDAAISWGGQSELLHRMALGFSPGIFNVLADATGNPQGPGTSQHLQKTLGPLLTAKLQVSLAFAPMPIQDAIDLARFLVYSTIMFSRFLPGPQVVGGPIEIAAITKHEGFKWISRKHYYNQEFNKEIFHVTCDRRDDNRETSERDSEAAV